MNISKEMNSKELGEMKLELGKKMIENQAKAFTFAFILCTVGSAFIGYHFHSISLFAGISSIAVGLVLGMFATTMASN